MSAPAPTRSSAVLWKRAILWAFALVVAFFLTDTIVSQRLASAIDDAAGLIVTDYAPSVVALASARAELHRLQDFASDYVSGGGHAADRQRMMASQAEFNRAVAAYERLPFGPGERELWARVGDDIRTLQATLARMLRAVDDRDFGTANLIVTQDLRAAVDTAGAHILSNIELNARAADDAAHLIARRRRESLRAATVLDVASVALTAIVALLVYQLIEQREALQRQRTSLLQAMNAELEVFASRLSHDIVSPLASTRLSIDSVLKGEQDEPTRQVLRRGLKGLDRATRLAHALLDFARAGARPARDERADVRAVVNGVVDELRPMADEAGARLEVSSPERVAVACNEGLLTSAVANLVRNAINYLDGAGIKRVDVLAVEAGDHVKIEVRDTGPGLAPGSEASVFDPYVRGPDVGTPGLGLGLATVKRIVETHGGAVGVESRPGSGCRFWIDLPKASVAG